MSKNEVFIEEIQKVTDKISENFHCNPKEFQREEVIGVVLMREKKAFSETKFCAAIKGLAAEPLNRGSIHFTLQNLFHQWDFL